MDDPSFWQSHGDEISAAITLGVAILLAILVDRFLIGRAERVTENMETAQFSREARTRLRLIRRLVFVAIILIGVALALSQFASIKRFATGILASTAVLGLVIGFAGRTVIANFVAGVMMAIRQPIRIGDLITLGEEVHGRVADIALTFTAVDGGDGSLLIVPNEKVVNEVVVNHSAGNRQAPIIAEVWLAPDADLEAARRALEGTEVTSASLAELTPDGARLELKAAMDTGGNRAAREAELREHAQGALRRAGVLRAP
ncbi:MAG: mechanosensitive ion channel family protein [Solirubrobacterales bacterium]